MESIEKLLALDMMELVIALRNEEQKMEDKDTQEYKDFIEWACDEVIDEKLGEYTKQIECDKWEMYYFKEGYVFHIWDRDDILNQSAFISPEEAEVIINKEE